MIMRRKKIQKDIISSKFAKNYANYGILSKKQTKFAQFK